MPFWRRRQGAGPEPETPVVPEPDTTPDVEPDRGEPLEPTPPPAPSSPTAPVGPGATPEIDVDAEVAPDADVTPGTEAPSAVLDAAGSSGTVPAGPGADVSAEPAAEAEPPAPAPFDPTAFLAVAPAHTLDQGLEKTRGSFMTQLRGYLGGADGPMWDEVEETLIAGDVGAALSMDLVERARRRRDTTSAEAAIREELAGLLVPRGADWTPQASVDGGPAVVLVVGVNGTGKTTTIGKLAARYVGEGRTVILAAADTFRAAAIDQLRIWADRAGVPVVAHAPGADPGAVVYDALDAAIARRADMVIADTAGRLHTKSNLMDELTKVRRIIDKRIAGARPETLFVLDATTGQNGLAQARAFHEAVGLTGIVLTKLDSTAKGGIVFAIEDALKVPVRFIGVGEGVADLLPFDPDAFVEALFA